VVAVRAEAGAVQASIRLRGRQKRIDVDAGWLVNCTGPTPSNNAEANPVIASLLVHGWLKVDDLALGVETDFDGAAIAAYGTRTPDMFVVGTLRKASLWESIAAPELREQAAATAERILALLAQSALPRSASA
jgi:uncharacterized NAD(P)/FAD-binding protein YdhS